MKGYSGSGKIKIKDETNSLFKIFVHFEVVTTFSIVDYQTFRFEMLFSDIYHFDLLKQRYYQLTLVNENRSQYLCSEERNVM